MTSHGNPATHPDSAYRLPATCSTWEGVALSREELWGEARREDLWRDGTRTWAKILHQSTRTILDWEELLVFHDRMRRSLLSSCLWPSPPTDKGRDAFKRWGSRIRRLFLSPPMTGTPPGLMTVFPSSYLPWASSFSNFQDGVYRFGYDEYPFLWSSEPELALWASVEVPGPDHRTDVTLCVQLGVLPITPEHRQKRVERWVEVFKAMGRITRLPREDRWHDAVVMSYFGTVLQGYDERLFEDPQHPLFALLGYWKHPLTLARLDPQPPLADPYGPAWKPLSGGLACHIFGAELREALLPFERELTALESGGEGKQPAWSLPSATFSSWVGKSFNKSVFLAATDASWQNWHRNAESHQGSGTFYRHQEVKR